MLALKHSFLVIIAVFFFGRSFSWSANICGCKKWLIYPPGQEQYLTDRLGNLAYDVTSDDMNDKHQFPDSEKASKPIKVIQRAGEVIFVPRYHSAFRQCSKYMCQIFSEHKNLLCSLLSCSLLPKHNLRS